MQESNLHHGMSLCCARPVDVHLAANLLQILLAAAIMLWLHSSLELGLPGAQTGCPVPDLIESLMQKCHSAAVL